MVIKKKQTQQNKLVGGFPHPFKKYAQVKLEEPFPPRDRGEKNLGENTFS